jgi:hypothetical protein
MKQKQNNVLKYFEIILIILFASLPSVANSESRQDFLMPCVNGLMGPDVINRYNDLIRRYLFTEKDADLSNIVRMVVEPSFDKEQYLAIYKTSKGIYKLEYSEPSDPILAAMQYDEIPEKYRGDMKKIEDIKISTHRKNISEKLAKSVSQVWLEMIKTQKFPSGNQFTILDGTIYQFSAGSGTCGMSFGVEGANVKSLIDIGEKLKEYALQEGTSQTTEHEIMNLANQLYKKNHTTN